MARKTSDLWLDLFLGMVYPQLLVLRLENKQMDERPHKRVTLRSTVSWYLKVSGDEEHTEIISVPVLTEQGRNLQRGCRGTAELLNSDCSHGKVQRGSRFKMEPGRKL